MYRKKINLASKVRDWQILIEKKEEWKRELSGLHICREEIGRMKRRVKGRKAKEKCRQHNSEIKQHSEQSEHKEDIFKTSNMTSLTCHMYIKRMTNQRKEQNNKKHQLNKPDLRSRLKTHSKMSL